MKPIMFSAIPRTTVSDCRPKVIDMWTSTPDVPIRASVSRVGTRFRDHDLFTGLFRFKGLQASGDDLQIGLECLCLVFRLFFSCSGPGFGSVEPHIRRSASRPGAAVT